MKAVFCQIEQKTKICNEPDKYHNVISMQLILNHSIQLSYEEPKLVFCHNDLNPQNIIYDSISRNVAILHLEYADINFQALEIARHFYTLRWLHFNNFQLYRAWGRQYLFYIYQFFCLDQVKKFSKEWEIGACSKIARNNLEIILQNLNLVNSRKCKNNLS